MMDNVPRLGIEDIIKSTRELIESEIDNRRDIYFLLDTNIALDSDFCNSTYHTKDYFGVDVQELKTAIKSVEFGSELLDNPVIFISDGVSKEINNFFDIVSERIKFFNDNPEDGRPKKKRGKVHSSSLENKKNLYLKLNAACYDLKKKLSEAIYPVEDPASYNEILSEVLKISGWKNLKREIIIKENIPRPFRRCRDKFNTDEELVSHAIYLNSVKNRPVSILSQDSDILRIWKCVSLIPIIKHLDIRVLNPYGKVMDEMGYIADC